MASRGSKYSARLPAATTSIRQGATWISSSSSTRPRAASRPISTSNRLSKICWGARSILWSLRISGIPTFALRSTGRESGSMERDPRVYLWDVQDAAADLIQFTAGLNFLEYQENKLVRAAVERKLEVIGQASNQLSKHSPELAQRIPELRRIVDFRNVLIHGYSTIDHDEVWENVQQRLPALRETVSAMLAELGPPEP